MLNDRSIKGSSLDAHVALPAELIEAAAALSVKEEDPAARLTEAMARIASVSADVEAGIRETKEMLEVRRE